MPAQPSFCQKMHAQCRINAENTGHSYLCAWPYWKYFYRSFPFRRKIYGRRILKWITQRDLLTFAFVKLLVYAPLFNGPKKHVLNYFALVMAAFVVARRRYHRGQRVHGTSINLFGMPGEHGPNPNISLEWFGLRLEVCIGHYGN